MPPGGSTGRGLRCRGGGVGAAKGFARWAIRRLAGYEDVNDAERLAHDPVMRQVVGDRAVDGQAASTSQMSRFETEGLATEGNRAALADLSGQWIDRFLDRTGLKYIVLDMDSSVSPTHGEQEGTAWNGHFGCACYHPLFLFNQFGDLERALLRNGNVASADGLQLSGRPESWSHHFANVLFNNMRGGVFARNHDVPLADFTAFLRDRNRRVADRQQALLESEERNGLAMKAAGLGAWDWDLQSNTVFYSDRFREILGYTPAEFPGTIDSFRSRLHPEDTEAIWAAIERHLKERVAYKVEYRLQTKSGEYLWFLALGQAGEGDEGHQVGGGHEPVGHVGDGRRAVDLEVVGVGSGDVAPVQGGCNRDVGGSVDG